KLSLDGPERVVEIAHEDPAHGVDHEDIAAVRSLEQAGSPPRRSLREIDRPQQPVVALDEDQGLALIPDVIAAGDDVGARVEQLGQDLLGDAEAAGSVLAVDHDEVGGVSLAETRQCLDQRRPPRPADHITKEYDPHELSRSAR